MKESFAVDASFKRARKLRCRTKTLQRDSKLYKKRAHKKVRQLFKAFIEFMNEKYTPKHISSGANLI
jgi:hypothetical protein